MGKNWKGKKKFSENILLALGFPPTDDQLNFISKVGEFLFYGGEQELFVLRGYAGTGKTSMLSCLTKVLPIFKMKSVLLAPTGRAAKVLSGYSKKTAFTIHKKIYKQFDSGEGGMQFGLGENKHKNTLFIVDEASMIGEDAGGNNNLLENLIEYVFSGENCKIIFSGDIAQLPPVGSILSPALNPAYLKNKFSFKIRGAELKQVVRQANESGILFNATALRVQLMTDPKKFPYLVETPDVKKLAGDELEDVLNWSYREYGEENVLLITRSNKRANLFNQQIRIRMKFQENRVAAGDLMMVVKNNYTWLDPKSSAGFIANGDAIEILKVVAMKEMYGLHFADVIFRMIDYPNEPELNAMLNLSVINTESSSMTFDEQKKFAALVLEDLEPGANRLQQLLYLKGNPYYNALQVKFSNAVTCHKSQGGQWPVIIIDQGYVTDEMMGEDFYRWLYTAMTRATEKVYLLNFSEKFFFEEVTGKK
jgi:exodeoxyribonuclease-5